MVSSHSAFESFQLQQFCRGRGGGVRVSFFLFFVPMASSWYHPMLHLKAFSCNSFAVEEEEEKELDFLSFCVPIASSWYHPMLHLQALDWNISFAVDIGEGGGDEDRIRKTQPALKP